MAHEKPIEHHPRIKPLSYGVFLPPFAEFAEPRRMVALAQSAEQAGWDGLYLWDHMLTIPGMAVADSFVMAAAIAQATERIRLGMMVTPLPRRRPWVFARQAATLDQLSEGRLDVGVGLGHDGWQEFSSFSGEVVDPVERASFLDDSLEILRRAWSGEPVEFEGERLWVKSVAFLPRPVQQPLPVWVACRWPHHRPLARAAHHQGCFPLFDAGGRELPGLPEPEQVAAVRTKLLDLGGPADIDIVCRGVSGPAAGHELSSRFAALEEAGMTWWLESFGRGEPPAVEVEAVVAAGPPR
jgi:alkanesulfonate monooxygenase SsuD/methylene tetrahydromethanopterin reductase-like flavin-dependent oxidoreductase (luciferase family)